MAKSAIQTFGKYQILERIAIGGSAEIYKAKLEGIGGFQRTFAIKRILPSLSQHSDYIAMLVDEAKVAGLLSHANIVQILDLGQVDGIWYIAMEYVDGQDLGAVLRRANRKGLCLPVPHAVFIANELLKGLEYAHQRTVMRGGKAVSLNIIHRDISPPNILMSYQGEVKLTDFGIARASLKMMETVSGIVKGRFDYMSPEQAEGRKDLDQRSDIFSVGGVLYEMLTGVHPFRAESELSTVERVRTGKYTAVSTRNPEVPFALQTIVDRALQVDRDKRYASATAFHEALDKFFHDAGFIFTHATLATYVKGLFPEAQKKRPVGTPTGSVSRDAVTSNRVVESHDSTGLMERPKLVNTTPTPGLSASEDLDAAKTPGASADEQVTVVGKYVDLDDEREIATVIRKSPFQEGELAELEASRPPDTSVASRSEQGYPVSVPGYVETPLRSSMIGWLGMVLAVFCLLIGIALGSLMGGGGAILLGAGTTPETLPVVRVLTQREVQVFLDGEPAPKSFTIPPDTLKNLEVRADDFAWSIPLTMAPGEVQVFVISVPKPTTRP